MNAGAEGHAGPPGGGGNAAPTARPGTPRLCPTHLGGKALLFVAVLVVTWFAIPYSNLFFLGLSFLAAIGLVGLVAAWCNVADLDAELTEMAPSPAGAPIPIAFTLRGTRPRYLLRGRLACGGAECRTPAVDALGEATLHGELPPLPRGIHRIERASIESTYPHGMLRARVRVPAPEELVVYPAPAPLRGATHGAGADLDLVAAGVDRARGAVSLRDWRAGDDPRAVHWKATARRGSLVVREPDGEHDDGIEIVLDRRCAAADLEAALSLIAALALRAAESKQRIGLRTQGTAANYLTGGAPLTALLRVLAALQPLPDDAPPPPPGPAGALRLPAGGRR